MTVVTVRFIDSVLGGFVRLPFESTTGALRFELKIFGSFLGGV